MIVAVASHGQDLDSPVHAHFGRAPFFVTVNVETMEYEAIPNPAASSTTGAGAQAAQLLVRSNVQAVAAGNVGPHATSVLQKAGIRVYVAREGTVREAVEALVHGQLEQQAEATMTGDSRKRRT